MAGRLARALGHTRWFAAFSRSVGSKLDRATYRVSDGRLSAPNVLLLTTTGRRSGRERTTPVMFVRDGTGFIVSSESFGQRRPAAWPLNLDANPEARVQLGSEVLRCRARRLSDAEADRHWSRLVEDWPAHETYRRRSGVRKAYVLDPIA
jgi:deazaflavin-dependent oxidoreductase (nitroreductase family)